MRVCVFFTALLVALLSHLLLVRKIQTCENAQTHAHVLLEKKKKMVSAEIRHGPKTPQPSSPTVDNCNRL